MRIAPSQTQVAAAFGRIEASDAVAESASLVREGSQPLEMLQAMAAAPDVLAGFAAMSEGVYPGGSLSRDVQEAVILAASVRNACQFCHQSHIDIAKAVGVASDPQAWIDSPATMSQHQKIAVRYTDQMLDDANGVSDGLFAQVHEAFGDAGSVELTMLVGYINMLNMFNNALQNRYHGELGG